MIYKAPKFVHTFAKKEEDEYKTDMNAESQGPRTQTTIKINT